MRFKIGGRDAGNTAAQDFSDDAGGIIGTVNAKIGELVRHDALRVKRAEAGFIAEQWATRHGHTPGKKDFDTGIKPYYGDAGVAEEFGSAGLRVGAAAEGENG